MTDLEQAFDSDEPEVRRAATASLRGAKGEPRTPLLLAALGDPDWRVRREAVAVAADVTEAWGLLPELVDGLCQGDNVGLRNAALEVLERLGPRSANALLVALPRVPAGARKFLVTALGFAGGAGVGKLADLSNDPDPNTAQAALEALARVGGPQAEEALRQHLASVDPVQRLAALEGLERLEAQLRLDEVRPLLEDRLVRRLALRVLGFSDEPEAVEPLLQALGDGGAVASEAAAALGALLGRGGPAARALCRAATALTDEGRRSLRQIAATGRPRPRRAAIALLLLARDPEALGPAAELAADDRLPPLALEAVRRWGIGAVEPLLAVEGARSGRARAAALEMASELASVGEPSPQLLASLRRALRSALASDEAPVAATAAAGLLPWAEAEDAEPLVRAARQHPELAARPAGRALERLARVAPGEVERALFGVELDGPLGAALLGAVASIGGSSATDLLQATLNADDPRARRAAVLALPQLGGERAVELAGFALADEDVDVQVAAVAVLERLAASEADDARIQSHLRLALRAGFDPVVAAAARAVGAIGDEEALPTLRELVCEGRAGVAVAAMESLRAMQDPALDDILVDALGQPDEELVKEALRAAAQSSSPRRSARVAIALEHAAWDVRQVAATLLGRIGGPGAEEALRRRLEREEDAGVRRALEEALTRVAGEG